MQVGDLVDDKYELVDLIGEGGMGVVYEARHVRIGRRVALKFLHPPFRERPEIVTRLIREAQAAAAIGSEHIVDITDVGETQEGIPYLVMEYLVGEDLSVVLARDGRVEPSRAILFILHACRALAAAHEQGIIHRDLKPDNLFLTCREDGREWIKVVDFGIAKFRDALAHDDPFAPRLTATGATMGTPYYMSPEQARGSRELDHRADVYSLGVILFELVSGMPPFEGESFNELIINIATGEPRSLEEVCPDLDDGLVAAIHRAMHRDQKHRFPDIAAFADALAPFVWVDVGGPQQPLSGSFRSAELGRAAQAPSHIASPSSPGPNPQVERPADAMADTLLGWKGEHGPAAQRDDEESPAVAAIPINEAGDRPPAEVRQRTTPDQSGEVVLRRRSRGVWAVLVALFVALPAFAVGAMMLSGGDQPETTPRDETLPAAAGMPPPPDRQPAGDAGGRTPPLGTGPGANAPGNTVLLQVAVEPAGAEILLDGITLENNPFSGRFPRDGARHRLEARAEGYATRARFVVFDEDRSVRLILTAAELPTATSSRTGGDSPVRRRPAARRPASAKRRGASWQIDRANPYGGGQ